MIVFVDTSAFFAILAEDEADHVVALQRLQYLSANHVPLATSNYVVVETCAVLQRRLGMKTVHAFREEALPAAAVKWVTQRQHEVALAGFIRADRRKLSLVDCVSFEVMRDNGIQTAFAFDRHFEEEGFDCAIPFTKCH